MITIAALKEKYAGRDKRAIGVKVRTVAGTEFVITQDIHNKQGVMARCTNVTSRSGHDIRVGMEIPLDGPAQIDEI